jgi:uncharacterized protein YjbI with pentapeptide repeats
MKFMMPCAQEPNWRIEAAQAGLHRYWLAQGELEGGRFQVPDGNLQVQFAHARLVGVDLSGLDFAGFLAHDSVFERCDFTRASLGHVLFGATGYGFRGRWDERAWPRTVYRECVFTRTRIPPNAFFGNARFEGCVFDGARLRDQTSTGEAEFVDCTFRGKVQDVNFWGVPGHYTEALARDRNEFAGNDFTGAELISISFRHIDLGAQQFPGLPGYAVLDRVDRRVAAALETIAEWPEGDHKRHAMWSLQFEADNAAKYNDGHALVSREWIGMRIPPDRREEIFWMLVNYSDEKQ